MPAGCEFFCNNEDCKQYKNGLTIVAPWPIGDIDKIIDARNVSKMEDFRDGLIKLKSEGRSFACITYPNINEIETAGYRVNKWCNKCKCVWMFDVLLKDGATTFEEALAKSDVPENCSKCNEKLKDFEHVIEDGINCPFCNEKLKSSRWFSNETTKDH